jgi:transposase
MSSCFGTKFSQLLPVGERDGWHVKRTLRTMARTSQLTQTPVLLRMAPEAAIRPIETSNDIVVLDNLGSHKGKAVRQAIKAAGARLLFLPKYSPDLNPIEQLFAKLKGQLRKAAPRTLDALSDAIAQTLAQISKHECANYLTNAGYASI